MKIIIGMEQFGVVDVIFNGSLTFDSVFIGNVGTAIKRCRIDITAANYDIMFGFLAYKVKVEGAFLTQYINCSSVK